ncbi:MAG: hypothetical protein IPP29_09055 [Bacteroidetes bacterium]|nr:hypothetical protein [Bacteroidota bacterium]
MIENILEKAYNKGLKVILVAGGKLHEYSPNFSDEYNLYLQQLAIYMKNSASLNARKALLGYDLMNEPLWSAQSKWPDCIDGQSKQDVCNSVNNWYFTLNKYDHDHLVTLGGSGIEDVFQWDPAVMKLDFYSPHFYPNLQPYEGTTHQEKVDLAIERALGNVCWLKKNCPFPFIIGETGFQAQAGLSYPSDPVNGTLQQQKEYAEQTLKYVYDCDGSGYSWWIYQNMYWGADGSYYGLLDFGLCNPIPCAPLYKPIVAAFTNFSSTALKDPCNAPSNYHDPFNHSIYSPNTNIIHGNIKDDDGNPVEDAVVFGYTILEVDVNNNALSIDHHYTLSDPIGNFSLIPYDFINNFPPEPNTIVDMTISATGCERLHYGWANGSTNCPPIIPNPPPTTNQNYVVKRIHYNYDNYVKNKNIDIASYEKLEWMEHTHDRNVTIQPFVTSKIAAAKRGYFIARLRCIIQ